MDQPLRIIEKRSGHIDHEYVTIDEDAPPSEKPMRHVPNAFRFTKAQLFGLAASGVAGLAAGWAGTRPEDVPVILAILLCAAALASKGVGLAMRHRRAPLGLARTEPMRSADVASEWSDRAHAV
jgi:hypothetical protein